MHSSPRSLVLLYCTLTTTHTLRTNDLQQHRVCWENCKLYSNCSRNEGGVRVETAMQGLPNRKQYNCLNNNHNDNNNSNTINIARYRHPLDIIPFFCESNTTRGTYWKLCRLSYLGGLITRPIHNRTESERARERRAVNPSIQSGCHFFFCCCCSSSRVSPLALSTSGIDTSATTPSRVTHKDTRRYFQQLDEEIPRNSQVVDHTAQHKSN